MNLWSFDSLLIAPVSQLVTEPHERSKFQKVSEEIVDVLPLSHTNISEFIFGSEPFWMNEIPSKPPILVNSDLNMITYVAWMNSPLKSYSFCVYKIQFWKASTEWISRIAVNFVEWILDVGQRWPVSRKCSIAWLNFSMYRSTRGVYFAGSRTACPALTLSAFSYNQV